MLVKLQAHGLGQPRIPRACRPRFHRGAAVVIQGALACRGTRAHAVSLQSMGAQQQTVQPLGLLRQEWFLPALQFGAGVATRWPQN